MNPDCFGREYFDEDKTECPHEECLLRYECKEVFLMAVGILRSPSKPEEAPPQKRVVVSGGVRKKRSGYVKPGRLLYKDEGTLRDKILFNLRDYLSQFNYQVKATKCLHSFVKDKKFVLKADTRRKNSVLLYVSDELSEFLMEEGFACRGLFDSERPNFPSYLEWVITLMCDGDVSRFMVAFDAWKEANSDLE